jgi:Lipocalin-like domain
MMYRRDVLGISLAAAIALLPGAAVAQQPQRPTPPPAQQQAQRPIKDLLVGAWTLLLADGKKSDNTQSPLFGPNPIGSLIFTGNGRFSWQVMRTISRPPFKSNNRDTGTADENKQTTQGTLSFFGTYTVDETAKTINVHIEGSSFPNLEGARGRWSVAEITDEVMTFDVPIAETSIPNDAAYTLIQNIWKKVK